MLPDEAAEWHWQVGSLPSVEKRRRRKNFKMFTLSVYGFAQAVPCFPTQTDITKGFLLVIFTASFIIDGCTTFHWDRGHG